MTNPMRGEGEIGGKKIVVDFNGWCSLEAATGKKVPELLNEMKDGLGFNDLRTWVSVFLEDPISTDEVGDLIGGNYEQTLASLTAAIEGFFASAKEKKANPPKAA